MATQPGALAVPDRRWRNLDSRSEILSDHPVLLLLPPYEDPDRRVALPALKAGVRPAGTVVAVEVTRPLTTSDSLHSFVREVSLRCPDCPVVVLLRMRSEEALVASARLAPARFRAVVQVGPQMVSILRDALTDTTSFPRDVVEWLRLRSLRLNANQADLLEKIFAFAPHHHDVTTLLAEAGVPTSTARFRLRKRGLPRPGRWFQVARALHAALRLQAQPDLSTASLAYQLGFSDHSALAHLLRRSLAVTSNQIRGNLGWEWLLCRWLRANGILVR
jgi:AraC-like DNA-binding protein